MARFLLIITVFLLTFPVYSQEYFNKRFEFGQPGIWDGATNVFNLPDGYIISGGTGTPGNEFWYRIGFSKIDFQGNELFSKLYGDNNAEYFIGNPGSIVRLNDSIIITVGGKREHTTNWVHDEGILFFLNNIFDTLFCKYFGENQPPYDTSYSFRQVKKDFENDIIMVGTKKPYGLAEKILLIKTGHQGNQIWGKTYGYGFYYQGHSVICTSDGGYAIGGFTWHPSPPPDYTGDPLVVKTDSAGNQQWLKVFGGSYEESRGMVCSTLDGNMVLGFCYCDWMIGETSFRRINLIKLDNAGTVIWDKKYGESTYEKTLLNIRENTDGSLIATGITHLSKEYSSKDLGWIMKTAENGDSLWYREYDVCEGDESNNWLYDAVQTPDNGYLACGVVYPQLPDTGSQDGWGLKVDSLGCESPGNCWVGMKQENDIPAKDLLSIYPNPAREQVNFIIRKTKEEVRIELFDIFGRKVKELKVPEGIERTILDISDLPGGLYMIRAETRDGIFGKGKLVVK